VGFRVHWNNAFLLLDDAGVSDHIFPAQGAFSANGQTSDGQVSGVFRWIEAERGSTSGT